MPITPKAPSQRLSRTLTVCNPLGLHARPAAEWVRLARTFHSQFTISYKEQRYDGARLMDLLMANLDCGASFTLEAEGPDAEAALDRFEKLLLELRDAEARGDYA